MRKKRQEKREKRKEKREKEKREKRKEKRKEHLNDQPMPRFFNSFQGIAPSNCPRMFALLASVPLKRQDAHAAIEFGSKRERENRRGDVCFLSLSFCSTTTAANRKLTSCSSSRPSRRPCLRSTSPGGRRMTRRPRLRRQRRHRRRRFPPWLRERGV